jgi:hypothetical protein
MRANNPPCADDSGCALVPREPVSDLRHRKAGRCRASQRRRHGIAVPPCPSCGLPRGRSLFATHVVHTATTLLGGDRAFNLTFDPSTVASTIGGWPNIPLAERLTSEGLVEAESTGSARTTLGTIVPAEPEFSSTIGRIPTDEEHEARRLRDLLEEGAAQLREWSPGIVVVDASRDLSRMRRCCRVAELMREHWASHLALVMLVADTYPGFVFTIVPGTQIRRICFSSNPRSTSMFEWSSSYPHVWWAAGDDLPTRRCLRELSSILCSRARTPNRSARTPLSH